MTRPAVTYIFLYYTIIQPRWKCRTSISNKHNSRPTTNINNTPHILWPRFPWHTRPSFL